MFCHIFHPSPSAFHKFRKIIVLFHQQAIHLHHKLMHCHLQLFLLLAQGPFQRVLKLDFHRKIHESNQLLHQIALSHRFEAQHLEFLIFHLNSYLLLRDQLFFKSLIIGQQLKPHRFHLQQQLYQINLHLEEGQMKQAAQPFNCTQVQQH